MKRCLSLLHFVLILGFNVVAYAAEDCKTIGTDTPPIYIVPTGYDSSTGKDAKETKRDNGDGYANYYQGRKEESQGDKGSNRFFVPKRSIVQVSAKFKEVIENSGKYPSNETYIPVRVLSVPPANTKLQESSDPKIKSIAQFPYDPNLMAKVGSIGYLKLADMEVLEKQQDYVFIVKKDSELFKKFNNPEWKGLSALEPFALKLRVVDGKYQVNRCCKTISEKNECADYPIFTVLNVQRPNGKDVVIDDLRTFECVRSLVPMEEKFVSSIKSILANPGLGLAQDGALSSIEDLNFVDSRGLVQMPMANLNKDLRKGPYNTSHNGVEKGDPDAYLKPDVACGVMAAFKAWNETCKGHDACDIQFGDSSHAYHKNSLGAEPWVHAEHTKGECIDMNYSRMDSKHRAPLVKLFDKLGRGNCFSNDPAMVRAGCTSDSEHKGHVHMCFKSNLDSDVIVNPKLRQACEQGIK